MISNMIQKYGYHPNRSCTQKIKHSSRWIKFLQLTVNWFATVTLNSFDQDAVGLLNEHLEIVKYFGESGIKLNLNFDWDSVSRPHKLKLGRP